MYIKKEKNDDVHKKGMEMNISKVSLNSANFGSIKRSAAARAIELANGDSKKLFDVSAAIEDQRNNKRYDIKGLPAYESCNYIVVKRGEDSGERFMNLENACNYASMRQHLDIKAERLKAAQGVLPDFKLFANSLLDMCED